MNSSHDTIDDVSALAWVQDELRKSLDAAHKALRRTLKETESTFDSDLDDVDPAQLRIARQQLHQGVGVLELVGLPAGAALLRGSEAAVQRFIGKPHKIDLPAVELIEHASFALLDYLARRLAGKPVSTVALFPQYRAVQELAGAERIHPADLWPQDWQWHAVAADPTVAPRGADASLLSEFESQSLALMRQPGPDTPRRLSELSAGLAAGAGDTQSATLWHLAAGFFEAQALGLLQPDVYSKRVTSRLLAQLRAQLRGESAAGERLAQDLCFFCAQSATPAAGQAPRLSAVRRAFPATHESLPADYNEVLLGRYDPAWVTQARKRVATAKDSWSAVAGGEMHRLTGLNEQFTLVADSLRRLVPGGEVLGDALAHAVGQTVQAAAAPQPTLAMEVATSLLYVEAALEDGAFDQPEQTARVQRLAQRIDAVQGGAAPQPLEGWMEELYRRVSDRQTMGSVVQELRAALSESEKAIDQFFRAPAEPTVLVPVPTQLQAMRGVLTVLGLDQASHAVLRMRDDVDALVQAGGEARHQRPLFERLAANLSALSFLIDLLGVQPQAAKSMFAFDAASGLLVSQVGRGASALEAAAAPRLEPVLIAEAQALADGASSASMPLDELAHGIERLSLLPEVAAQPELAERLSTAQATLDASVGSEQDVRDSVAGTLHEFANTALEPVGLEPAEPSSAPLPLIPIETPAPVEATGLEGDDEMREVFLEEAREVIDTARGALGALRETPADVEQLTTVRRAFHTLKGSSRMVGLKDFGEAAWACEQLYNAWLATQDPASDKLLQNTGETLDYLAGWVDAIAAGSVSGWRSAPVRAAADALRVEGRYLKLADATAVSAAPPDITLRLPPASDLDLPRPVPAGAAEPNAPVIVDAAPAVRPPVAVPPAPPLATTNPLAGLDFTLDLGGPLAEPAPAGAPLAGFDEAFELIDAPAPAADDDGPAALAPPPEEPPALDDAVEQRSDEDGLSPTAPMPLDELPDAAQLAEAVITSFDLTIPVADALSPDDAPALFEPLAPTVPVAQAFGDAAAEAPPAAEALQRPFEDSAVAVEGVLEASAIVEPLHPSAPGRLGTAESMPAEAPAQPAVPAFEAAQPEPAASFEPAAVPAAAIDVADVPAAAAPAAEPEPAPSDEPYNDQVRMVGPLRIGIPLFNIFLNEADELSRRLGTELSEWTLERQQPVGESTVALAHSLAGSSATVGFAELSALARELEHALMRSQTLGGGSADDAQLFLDVSDEMRRLLHQFAAGFLKSPPAELRERLAAHELGIARRLEAQAAAQAQAVAGGHGAPPVEAVPSVLGDLGQAEFKPFVPLVDAPQRPAPVLAIDDDEDIDAIDAVDADLFPFFEEEAQELLPELSAQLRDWAQHPGTVAHAAASMRTLHTLKGGARLAGAMRLGELSHRLETAIEHLLARENATAPEVEALLGRADGLNASFEALRQRDAIAYAAAQEAAVRPLTDTDQAHVVTTAWPPLDESTPLEPVLPMPMPNELAEPAGLEAAAESPPFDAAPLEAAAPDASAPVPRVVAREIDWSRFAPASGAPEPLAPVERAPLQSAAAVRVRTQLLDRMVNQAGEVSITRARLESEVGQIKGSLGDLTENLERLRQQLRDIELQAETQMSTRMEAAKAAAQSFDPLEFDRFTRFQELTRMMAESVNDVATVQRALQRTLETAEDELAAQARLTRDLQDDLLRTRMVEFEGLSDRLYRVVRQAAKETGKQVRLDIVGGSIEVDRGVLDRMTGAFEHLLRNCITHGIESPEARAAAGKDAAGHIVVALHQEGNEVSVEFRDDGAGLNLLRIRDKGMAMGLLEPAASYSDAELANLIFTPGFSTAESVTELAGRGVGMDVVRSEVNALGGRIETASAYGQGTSFRLVLPLTTAVTQVVMLRCGQATVAVPSTLVEIVRRASGAEIEGAYRSGGYVYADHTLPFFWLGALLQLGARSGEAGGRTLPVVVVRSAQQRVALHVDEVLGNQEVVVKNLGPQLSRLPGLAGMTLLASGAVSLIYNPVALATVYGEQARHAMVAALHAEPQAPQAAAPVAPVAPMILVVDDSLTVRRVTQRLLAREGYRVVLAKDGLDALERLAEERPAVVLSDIEMPRMDGFDLVRNIRGDRTLAALPVIMITSRIAQKHREYAAELGVNHYLGKPYSEEELLALIGRYCAVGAAPA